MYYRVTLLNDSQDKSAADIIWVQEESFFYVSSNNAKLRNHLEMILDKDVYLLSPGVNKQGYSSDGVIYIQRQTPYYFEAIPEILSWRGYKTEFHGEAHKSMITMKASGLDNIRTNDKGERIVQRVPQGYMAVNTHDGRYLMAGKWLNANIDKEDAEWSLEPNPYEQMSEEQRQAEYKDMKLGRKKLHVAANPRAYDEDFAERLVEAYLKRYPSVEGKKLSQIYEKEEQAEPKKDLGYQVPGQPSVLYSPVLGLAIDSDIFLEKVESLPEEFEDYEWFALPYDKNLDQSAKRLLNPDGRIDVDPRLLWGTDSGAVKMSRTASDTGSWQAEASPWEFNAKETRDVRLNEREKRERVALITQATPRAIREKIDSVKSTLRGIVNQMQRPSMFSGKMVYDPSRAAAINVPGLYFQGDDDIPEDAAVFQGSFDGGREYQKAVVASASELSQYERFGGPKGAHGHMMLASYGTGKTAMACAWWCALRNRVHNGKRLVEPGKQTMIISAPNPNQGVWAGEYERFVGEEAFRIHGSAADRAGQWEELFHRANAGTLPSAILVPTSFFRTARAGEGNLIEDNSDFTPTADAQMMRMLMRGGSFGDVRVEGGHVAAMVLDESGQYVNRDSNRNKVLGSVLNDLYESGGLNLTMNGDISGNSAADTISEMGFINAGVRDNADSVKAMYTKRFGKNRARWANATSAKEFLSLFGASVTRLSGKWLAGNKHGLYYTDDIIAPMGKVWGDVYKQGVALLESAQSSSDEHIRGRSLGMLSILAGASYGAIHPNRMLEYDFGTDAMIQGLSDSGYSPEEIKEVRSKIAEYLDEVTEAEPGSNRWIRLPLLGMPTSTRDNIAQMILGEKLINDMTYVTQSWDVPALDSIVDGIGEELSGKTSIDGKRKRLGVAGFSRTAIESLHARLLHKYGDSVDINLITGGMKAEDVKKIQDSHNEETGRPVITLVTSAGKYGLSLAAERSWRFPMWNPATGDQMTGRFHRDPFQPHVATVVAPGGVVQYMAYVAQEKKKIQDDAFVGLLSSQEFLDALDDEREIDLSGMNFDENEFIAFMDALESESFRPEIFEKEYKDMSPQELSDIGKRSAAIRQVGLAKVEQKRAERAKLAKEEDAEAKAVRDVREVANWTPAEEIKRTLAGKSKTAPPTPSPIPAPTAAPTKPPAAAPISSSKQKTEIPKSAPVVPRKSGLSRKAVYDTPTMSRNPLYEGDA